MSSAQSRSPEKTNPIVGIGASAGGLDPLCTFFAALPADTGAAFVVVMHLSPEHHSELASILGRKTSMPVTEVQGRVALAANHVYVIPPDRRLELTDAELSAKPYGQSAERRTAVDLLFRSLAAHRGNGFAVILSGGGSDGAVGVKAVKENGGVILVQDPTEAEFDSMPRAAIATGIADLVLPAGELAERLAALIRDRDSIQRRLPAPEALEADDQAMLKRIIRYLNARTGHDFSHYKRSTVLRRVTRRMQVHGLRTLAQYLAFLRDTAEEAQGLFRDMLISVTSFFRDAPAWEALARQVIPKLFDAAPAQEPLRVWVPGCATGEEAYSLAILLLEEAGRRDEPREVQVFASDLDDRALAVAREGRYGQAIEADVSAERLGRFFVREADHYRVDRALRDLVLFAHHSLLRDPPFARQDLISCRNLLIYLDRELQEQVFGILHYALRPGGYLFLGVSEHAGREAFNVVDKHHHIYVAREMSGHALPLLPDMLTTPQRPPDIGPEPETPPRERSSPPTAHRALLETLGPPSVLVDDRRRIIHLSETAGRYLEMPQGPPDPDITRMVRRELQPELSAALYAAFEKRERTLSAFVPVQFNGKPRSVAVLVQPRPAAEGGEHLALVVFLDAGEAHSTKVTPEATDASPDVVHRLQQELSETRTRLHTAQEEFEATNEDLRAANEELQSLNEEYRSTGEELETSKEELQSINEELQTVNAELKRKLEEVSRAHNDLENLMKATEVPTLFLDRELCIQRFTPQLAELFSIRSGDLERPVRELHRAIQYDTLEADAAQVLRDLAPVEREVTSDDGRWYLARLRPYRTADHHIDGVVITFLDFTAQKRAEQVLRNARHYAESIVETVRQPLLVLTEDLRVEAANASFYETFGVTPGETRGQHIYTLGNGQWDIPELRELLDDVLPRDNAFEGYRVAHDFEQIGPRLMLLNGRRLDHLQRVLLAIEDITEREQAVAALRDSEERFRVLVEATTDAVWETDAEGAVVQDSPSWRRHTGQACEQFLGDGWLDAVHPDDRDRARHEWQGAVAAGRVIDAELRLRTADGRWIWSRLHAAPIRNERGAVVKWVAMSRDVTERREAAEALREADRQKDRFLSMLGHELRNPLAAITTMVEVLRMEQPSAERVAQSVEIIGRQTRHLTRLVDDLLSLSRIRRGKLALRKLPMDLTESIHDAAAQAQPAIAAKGQHLELDLPDAPLPVAGDRERLTQILSNLLMNAAHYSDAGGRIALSAQTAGDRVRVQVRDNGIGIAAEDLPRLFEPFTRFGGAAEHHQDGLGLGLALARQLADLHGGTLTAQSDGPGQGSELTLTLPLDAGGDAADAAAQAPAGPIPPRRVLVVDDDPAVGPTLVMLLEHLGQTVRLLTRGGEVPEAVAAFAPALVILDIGLPDMDGHEVARRLRDAHGPDAFSIVALSGYGQDAAASTERADFDQYLLKPATAERIKQLLTQL
ncbi:chemotaxis protein CheB [uncultured Thiohalocapsa sp.]|uniref:chemotaxis protein CheB n=1 Tax=uncultured Thiohalocapsa sp. TaxID=768990 RepID=UPI0025DF84BE|nr:chemotaxis protein CheB [uncultured Thiohalocapsa sp.]